MSVSNLQDALDHLQNQEVEAAISTLEKTVEEIPAHLPAHVLLARAYELKKAWSDALQSWKNAHFLMPNSPTVEKGRARVMRRVEEKREAADRESSSGPFSGASRPKGSESPPTSAPAPSPSEDAPSENAPSESDSAPSPSPSAAQSAAPDADEEASSRQRPAAQAEPDSSTEAAGSETAGPDSSTAGSSPEEADGLSELEKLRQQAEAEARQGGARPGLSAQQQLQQNQEEPQTPSASPEDPTAAEAPEEQEDDVTGDLDRLIRELESARIDPRPDPDEEDAFDDLPEPDLDDDIDDLVSETLARIYAAQEKYEEAARIYVKLASQEPTQARHHLENAAEMQEKAKAQG